MVIVLPSEEYLQAGVMAERNLRLAFEFMLFRKSIQELSEENKLSYSRCYNIVRRILTRAVFWRNGTRIKSIGDVYRLDNLQDIIQDVGLVRYGILYNDTCDRYEKPG